MKILLNGAVRAREITRAARDRLLVQMTDEVAGLVLRNNYLQGQAISIGEFQARQRLAENAYVIRALERSGDLNRAWSSCRRDEDIAERRKAGEGLTRPELAIILSYGKIWLYRALIHSERARGSLSVRGAQPLLSGAGAEALRAARSEAPSSAPRDHRDRDHQQLDQPHGSGVPGARAGRYRRGSGGHCARLQHRARGVRGARHLGADRGAGQPHPGRRAVHRDVSNHAPAAAYELLAAREPARGPGHQARGVALCRQGGELLRELHGVLSASRSRRA